MHATWSGHLEVVRYLVEQGANKEARAKDGETALMRAAGRGHLGVVQYLVEQGANEEAKNNDGITALIKAAEENRLQVVRYLANRGADKEFRTKDGETALIRAAGRGHRAVVRYLVEKGADSACLDNDNNSALLLLLMRSGTDEGNILLIAKLLLEHGAPPLQTNKEGYSAKSIAQTMDYHRVTALVEEYAVKSHRQQYVEGFTSDDATPSLQSSTQQFSQAPQFKFIPHSAIVKLGRVLGQGSFGTVYHAKWCGIEVVMKEISAVEIRGFLKEVNIWKRLRHDNVVPFYGANHRQKPYFIVSKYASKGKLVDYIKSEKVKSNRMVVWRKMKEVAAGLSYLHGEDVVHGDLRGDNIVVGDNGTAMLTDFGLSFSESGSCSLKKLKDTLGVMQWRAPEFAKMTVETPTHKSDVYSLGMCIIEAMIGTTPWGVERHPQVIREFLRRNMVEVEKPREMTNAQWVLVSCMIKFNPWDRPDMEYVLSELENFAKSEEKEELQVASSVHDDIRVGAVNDQVDDTDVMTSHISIASARWSNRDAASC